jgi:hypothetical protein
MQTFTGHSKPALLILRFLLQAPSSAVSLPILNSKELSADVNLNPIVGVITASMKCRRCSGAGIH